MKVALIERLTDNRKIEIRNIDEKELLSRFTDISELDIYGGFTAISNDIKYYITIVSYE